MRGGGANEGSDFDAPGSFSGVPQARALVALATSGLYVGSLFLPGFAFSGSLRLASVCALVFIGFGHGLLSHSTLGRGSDLALSVGIGMAVLSIVASIGVATRWWNSGVSVSLLAGFTVLSAVIALVRVVWKHRRHA